MEDFAVMAYYPQVDRFLEVNRYEYRDRAIAAARSANQNQNFWTRVIRVSTGERVIEYFPPRPGGPHV